jgi:hypothetical protein
VALLARIYLSIPAQTHNDSALRPLGQPFIATENHYQGGLKAGKGVVGRGVNAKKDLFCLLSNNHVFHLGPVLRP